MDGRKFVGLGVAAVAIGGLVYAGNLLGSDRSSAGNGDAFPKAPISNGNGEIVEEAFRDELSRVARWSTTAPNAVLNVTTLDGILSQVRGLREAPEAVDRLAAAMEEGGAPRELMEMVDREAVFVRAGRFTRFWTPGEGNAAPEAMVEDIESKITDYLERYPDSADAWRVVSTLTYFDGSLGSRSERLERLRDELDSEEGRALVSAALWQTQQMERAGEFMVEGDEEAFDLKEARGRWVLLAVMPDIFAERQMVEQELLNLAGRAGGKALTLVMVGGRDEESGAWENVAMSDFGPLARYGVFGGGSYLVFRPDGRLLAAPWSIGGAVQIVERQLGIEGTRRAAPLGRARTS